jgi:hypothetical protein
MVKYGAGHSVPRLLLAYVRRLSSARAQAMAGSEGVCPSPFYDEKKKVGGDGCHDKGSSTCTGGMGNGKPHSGQSRPDTHLTGATTVGMELCCRQDYNILVCAILQC